MNAVLNRFVRAYLARVPVTEGKRVLLDATRRFITPEEPEQIARTKHGFDLRLNLRNPEQARIYFYGDHDERYEVALVGRMVRPGMTCWDIGANIGFYTCLLARLTGPGGKVVAFEPASATRSRLQENVELNAFANVVVLGCAVGAASGDARLHFRAADLLEGTASLQASAGQGRSEPVELATLDSLVSRLGPPEFLKIDVEGAQIDVWRGGREFLTRHEPLIMAELRDSRDAAVLAEIESTVRDYGYLMYEMRKGCRVREAGSLRMDGPRNYMLARAGSRFARELQALLAEGSGR